MSQLDFVYAVFEDVKTIQPVVTALGKAGFASVDINVVGRDCPEFHHEAAKIKSPQAKYFVKYGIAGALAGLWGGAVLAPEIKYVVSFQIMTMVMASVSGGIVMAYIGTFLSAFFHASQPQYFANAYQGDVHNGAVVISVECASDKKRREAFAIIEDFAPVEIIARKAVLGDIIGVEKSVPAVVEKSEPQLAVVA